MFIFSSIQSQKIGSGLALPPSQGPSAIPGRAGRGDGRAASNGAPGGAERVGGPAADAAETQEGRERCKNATWDQKMEQV